jgi:hypothetical protein
MNYSPNRQICRQMSIFSSRRRQLAIAELLRHARVVSDPQKLAALNARLQCEKKAGGKSRLER